MPSPFLTPYVPQQYDRGPTMRIVDLLQQGGDARARALLQKSQLWGQAIQQLGQIPQQIMEGRAAERESKARADERQAQTDLRRRQMAAMEAEQGRRQQLTETLGSGRARGEILKTLEADPEAYKLATEHFGRVDSGRNRWMGEIAAGVRAFRDDPQAALAALADAEEQGYDPRRLEPLRQQIQQNPAAVSEIVDSLLMQSPDETHRAMVRKPAKLEEVSPGASLYDPSKGEAVFTAPVVEKPPASLDAAKAAAYAAGDMGKVAEITRLQAQEAAATRAEGGSDNRLWVKRGDQVLRIRESEYRPGDVPTSTREQGRPVTSGDAGRIADLDTSLDDLNTLGATLSGSKATGAAAKAGAMLPNFITEMSGLGMDAKQKQATIDRVKQVIGKALEGGVLRKEDEYKYEKILPTIGDPPEVVKTKLTGLWGAIQKRRQTTIDSLADAGYDTTRFESRTPRSRTDEKKADPLGIR